MAFSPDISSDLSDFERIVAQYGTLLLRTARFLVRDDATAEDVVQSSLELAWRNFATLRDRSALKAWLVKIVINQATSVRRREGVAASYVRQQEQAYVADFASAQAHEATSTQERLWDLRAAIEALPMEQRVVVVLHYYLDMTIAEIATMLETSPNTIKKRLGAALRRLRDILGLELLTDLPEGGANG